MRLVGTLLGLVLLGCGPASAPTALGKKELAPVRAIEQAFDAHDAKAYAALVTDDVALGISGRGDARGRAAAEASFVRLHTLFGKVRFRARRVFLHDDVAVVEYALTGTLEGSIGGVAPTHAPVGWLAGEVDRFAPDGRIRERHVYYDGATPMAQGKGGGRPIPAEVPLTVVAGRGSVDVAILDRLHDAGEKKDDATWNGLLADDIEWDDVAAPSPVRGRADLKAQWARTPLTDTNTSPIEAWSVGDFVLEEASSSGMRGNQLVVLYELRVAEVTGGKIVRGRTYANARELQEQLDGAK